MSPETGDTLGPRQRRGGRDGVAATLCAQVREPVNARGLGRWRTYAARLAPLIAEREHAGALAGWQEPPAQAGSPQR